MAWMAAPGTQPTARELTIFAAYCRGLEGKEIAARYGIGLNTVRTHIGNLYRRLSVDEGTRVDMRLAALSLGWLQVPESIDDSPDAYHAAINLDGLIRRGERIHAELGRAIREAREAA